MINGLTHIYPGTRRQPQRPALLRFNLNVAGGEFCVLSGPNGSGKSTLFRILCGLLLPSAGSVTIGGQNLFRVPRMVRRITGVVFQSPAVDKYLTVGENMSIHAALYGNLVGKAVGIHIAEALEWTDLKNRLDQRVDTLSGGLARQLELAKCLLTRPQVLLLDEPTTGLDPASRRNFLDMLKSIQRERAMTVLMTTHIFAEAEEAHRVVIMQDGQLLACDTPYRLCSRMGREMVVVVPTDPESLATAMNQDMNLTPLRSGDELRLENVQQTESLSLLEAILARYRSQIHSIAIKQAALEDVFIHLTSHKGELTQWKNTQSDLLRRADDGRFRHTSETER
ncbi:ABC transporter ATP-binding protein [invertebrate metagenome]|uniref:ABC transporter ATP-binding protein n=1 Tax=invertebrate metagenome TaxID=1711999 RepID=A0A484H708_9ZZZZ